MNSHELGEQLCTLENATSNLPQRTMGGHRQCSTYRATWPTEVHSKYARPQPQNLAFGSPRVGGLRQRGLSTQRHRFGSFEHRFRMVHLILRWSRTLRRLVTHTSFWERSLLKSLQWSLGKARRRPLYVQVVPRLPFSRSCLCLFGNVFSCIITVTRQTEFSR